MIFHGNFFLIFFTFYFGKLNKFQATLELISSDPNDKVGGKFLIHTMQVLKDKYCKQLETQKILPVNSENCTYHPFKVMVIFLFEIPSNWDFHGFFSDF